MKKDKKAKSLILQGGVSKNPEKIQSSDEINIKEFLRELARKREARRTIMDFVMELGENRNRRLGIIK